MNQKTGFAIFAAFTSLSMCQMLPTQAPRERDLYGLFLVLDPGHGGTDPGASGFFNNNGHSVRVVEDEYVADVARRLERMAKAHGAIVIATVYDKKQTAPIALPAHDVIPDDEQEVYAASGAKVQAGRSRYLRPRTDAANRALAEYPRHRVAFVSVHFDSTGNAGLSGAHLIGPSEGKPRLVGFLEEEFRREDRLRTLDGYEYEPVVRNDRIRSLFVLRNSNNRVKQSVLVELGNFSNEADVWRIRDYHVREEYAQIILRALIRLNQVPFAWCR